MLKLFKSCWELLSALFMAPSGFEWKWVGQRDASYKPSATRTFILSVLAFLLLFGINAIYEKSAGHSMSNLMTYSINGILDAIVFVAAIVLAAETWQNTTRKWQWFVCHGIVAFLGGLVFAYTILFVMILLIVVAILKFFLWAAFRVEIHPTSWIPNMGGSGSAGSASADGPSSGSEATDSGNSVESQDMFNSELKQEQAWGPDKHLVHDESQDSIYGNTYVDKDSGKEYRVTETDAFGHPTKVEEKWP